MNKYSRNTILTVCIVMEAGLLLLAAVWILCARIELIGKFQLLPAAFAWGLGAAVTSTALSLLCLTLGKGLPWISDLRKLTDDYLAPLMSDLHLFDILFLSLVSGLCEEVLFRGVIQAQLGIWVTSILFGLVHDPGFKQKAYVILAMLAGLGLGYIYQITDNLWSCISAHAIHNFLAMLCLRYFVKAPASQK